MALNELMWKNIDRRFYLAQSVFSCSYIYLYLLTVPANISKSDQHCFNVVDQRVIDKYGFVNRLIIFILLNDKICYIKNISPNQLQTVVHVVIQG